MGKTLVGSNALLRAWGRRGVAEGEVGGASEDVEKERKDEGESANPHLPFTVLLRLSVCEDYNCISLTKDFNKHCPLLACCFPALQLLRTSGAHRWT